MFAGTSRNHATLDQLNKVIWPYVEANMEAFAISVHRVMFARKPSLFQLFPFYEDESNKISFTDYGGTHTEYPAHSWFVICR